MWTSGGGREHIERVTPPWTPNGALGEALHRMRMTGAFYCRAELRSPFALDLPPLESCLMFHVLTSGRCTIEVAGAEPRQLRPGDLALVPHGDGHRLSNGRGVAAAKLFDVPREQLSDRYETLTYGGNGDATTMICGAVRFDHPVAQRLIALLPRLMVVDAASSPHAEWIQSTVRLLAVEARELRPGGEAVITRLADILVIQAIRSWLETDPSAQRGWVSALRDPRIGRAIALVHRDPGRRWTVASLAAEAAMSRSAFAARFTELVGEPIMQYVARWRMQLALTLLEDPHITLDEVASRLGYESEAAFSRAFRRFAGRSPGQVRRTAGRSSPFAATG